MENSNLRFGYLSLMLVGVFWGMQFMFNKIALAAASPELIAAFRVVFAAVVVTSYSVISGVSHQKKDAKKFSVTLFWLYIFIAFFEVIVPFFAMAWGQQSVSTGYASILVGTVPIFTLTLSVIVLKDRQYLMRKVISIALGFVGLVCLVSPTLGLDGVCGLSGSLVIMGGALCFSIASMLIRCIKNVHPVIITRNILLLGSIPMVMLILNHFSELANFSLSVWLALIALGSFSSAAAYLLYVNLITMISPVFASFANYLSPFFGLMFGCVFFSESIYLSTIVAILLLASSIVINNPSEGVKRLMGKMIFTRKNIEYNL